MKRAIIPILLFFCTLYIFHKQPTTSSTDVVVTPITPVSTEIEWIHLPPIRTITSMGKVLSDVESHLPAGHIYGDADRITHCHEATHGINSLIRQKFSRRGYLTSTNDGKPVFKSLDKINGFYVLEDRAIILQEPNVTLSQVAPHVPQSLRGDVYNLYLIQQAKSWSESLYILDEHSAYINGSDCRKDLGIQTRAETVQFMFEFNVYAITLLKTIKEQDGSYDDNLLKAFVKWQLERSRGIYAGESGAKQYWEKFKTNNDAQPLREFAKNYFGTEWCKKFLEI